jgi:GNAT superfamily N-acetyltransferase
MKGDTVAEGIRYRRAKSRDMAFVIEMWREMSSEVAAVNPRYRVSDNGEFIWGRWAGDVAGGENGCVILAEEGDNPVGCILAFIPDEAPIYANRPRGRISDIYVYSDYRKKGIGKELLKQAIEFLKGKGVKAIEVNMPKGVEGLGKLWEGAGMEAFAVRYHLLLDEET